MANDLKITYIDEPVGALEGTTPSVTSLQAFCALEDILDTKNTAPQRATLEDGYWVLGTAYRFFSDEPEKETWGLFSQAISSGDGAFTTPVVLTLELDDLYSSIGLTLRFDPYGPTWCSDMTAAWYRDDTLLAQEDFAPDDWEYTCYKEVRNFNKVVLTFKAMSHGYRYLKLERISYGITRVFDSEECYAADLYQDTNVVSDELAVNTLDFTLRNRSDVGFLFQRRQGLRVTFGDELLGIYHISTSSRAGKNLYDIHAVDKVGLLEMAGDHAGGVYNGVAASVILAEIMGAIPYTLASSLASVTLTGWLSKAPRRDNLQQVAFALGAMVRTGHSEAVDILPMPTGNATASWGQTESYEGGSVETAAPVTEVQLVAYAYLTGGESETLYDAELTGQAHVDFDAPVYGLAITGGEIVSSDANGAVIAGTGTQVVLTGTKYKEVKRIYAKENPLRSGNDEDNPVRYEGMTLVSPAMAPALLEKLYGVCMRQDTVKGKVLTVTERPGERVSILTDDGEMRTGHLISLDYTATGKLAADVAVLCDKEAET